MAKRTRLIRAAALLALATSACSTEVRYELDAYIDAVAACDDLYTAACEWANACAGDDVVACLDELVARDGTCEQQVSYDACMEISGHVLTECADRVRATSCDDGLTTLCRWFCFDYEPTLASTTSVELDRP